MVSTNAISTNVVGFCKYLYNDFDQSGQQIDKMYHCGASLALATYDISIRMLKNNGKLSNKVQISLGPTGLK